MRSSQPHSGLIWSRSTDDEVGLVVPIRAFDFFHRLLSMKLGETMQSVRYNQIVALRDEFEKLKFRLDIDDI